MKRQIEGLAYLALSDRLYAKMLSMPAQAKGKLNV
jgi:hypothetical protein